MNSGTSKVSVEFKGWAHELTFLLYGVPWSRVWYQQQLGKFLTSHPYPVQQRHYKGHFNLKRVILIKNIIDLLCWWRNSVLFEWCLKLSMSWWPGMCGCGGGLGFTWCHLLQIPQSRNLPQSVTNVFQHLGWLFQNVITLDGVLLMQVELSSCAMCSQVSCGQPEQEEQLSPLSNCPGVGWAASLERALTAAPECWVRGAQPGGVSWGGSSSQGWLPSVQCAAGQQWHRATWSSTAAVGKSPRGNRS